MKGCIATLQTSRAHLCSKKLLAARDQLPQMQADQQQLSLGENTKDSSASLGKSWSEGARRGLVFPCQLYVHQVALQQTIDFLHVLPLYTLKNVLKKKQFKLSKDSMSFLVTSLIV